MPGYTKRAMRQVAEYNARLNKQRKDEFPAYYDMQTNVGENVETSFISSALRFAALL